MTEELEQVSGGLSKEYGSSFIVYEAKKNDSYKSIAKKYKVDYKVLMDLNGNKKITAGMKVLITQ